MVREENAMVRDGYWTDENGCAEPINNDTRQAALDAEADRTEDEHKANRDDFNVVQQSVDEYKRAVDAQLKNYQDLILEQQALIERLQAALEAS